MVFPAPNRNRFGSLEISAPTRLSHTTTLLFISTAEAHLAEVPEAAPPPGALIPSADTAAQEENSISFFQSRSLDSNSLQKTRSSLALVAAIVTLIYLTNGEAMLDWNVQETVSRILQDSWDGYLKVLAAAPVQTKALTSATVYTIGDMISQRTEGVDIGNMDRGRIMRSLLAGLIGHGPMSHIWYHVSEDFFDHVLRMTEWWSFIPKIVLDQALWGPLWNNSYIILIGMMQLQHPSKMWSEIKRTTIPLVISGLKLWPLAHCVTYGLVPVENRLLWVDLVEIIWVVILATQTAGSSHNEHVPGDVSSETAP